MVGTITVDWLPVVSLCGHSMADGWGKSDRLFAEHLYLKPARALTQITSDLTNSYWKNIFVATSPQPFPQASHTPNTSDAGDVAWLEMTVANVKANTDPHPHAAPYNYPNVRGSCYPRYFYNAWKVAGLDGFHYSYQTRVTFAYDTESGGPFVEGETLTFASPTCTGLLEQLVDNGTTGTMTVVMSFNSTSLPIDNTTMTGGTSSATAAVNGTVTTEASHFDGTLIGVEIPLMVAWRDEWGTQVGLAKVAFSSSLFLPQELGPEPSAWLDPDFGGGSASSKTGTEAVPSAPNVSVVEQYAYWAPRDQFDWSPATARLYAIWEDKLLGAKAAMPAGKQMSVDLLVNWFGDNDALTRDRDYLEATFKASCIAMIAKQRALIAGQGMSRLPAEQIPVIWMGIHPGYNGPALATDFIPVDFCNQCLAEIATDDPYVRVVSVDDYANLSDEPDTPPVGMGAGATHLSHNGYVAASKDIMVAWRDIRTSTFDAIAEADRVKLSEVLLSVQQRYDRGGTSADVRREVMVGAINKAIRHVVNCAGDSCWWLNRTTSMLLTFGQDGLCSMPRHVARVLEIRDAADASRAPVQFRQVSFADGGRCQIILENEDRRGVGSGTYLVEHIGWPLDVTTDEQLLPFPRQLLEWVEIEACKRLASGSDNVAKFAMLNGEAAAIEARAMRQCARQRQAARDTLRYGRPRVQLGY